jgi:hypothetical protein
MCWNIRNSQPTDEADGENFYTYSYEFKEGNHLVIHDVGLLVNGVDGVYSTESLREEISFSLKNPECLSSPFEYRKEK